MFTMQVPPLFDGGTIEDAFHGTDAQAGALIGRNGFSLPERPTGQYGRGVYFFEGDYRAAVWYARKTVRKSRKKTAPAVLRASIELGQTLYLNLMAREIELLRREICRRLGQEATRQDACRVLYAAILRNNMADSLKVVRRANKPRIPGHFCAEIVVIVPDAKRIKKIQQVDVDVLNTTITLPVLRD